MQSLNLQTLFLSLQVRSHSSPRSRTRCTCGKLKKSGKGREWVSHTFITFTCAVVRHHVVGQLIHNNRCLIIFVARVKNTPRPFNCKSLTYGHDNFCSRLSFGWALRILMVIFGTKHYNFGHNSTFIGRKLSFMSPIVNSCPNMGCLLPSIFFAIGRGHSV